MRIALVAVPLLAGCGKLVTIEVQSGTEIVVPHGTLLEQLVGDLGFGDWLDMDLTAAQELQNQGVEPGDIVDVRLTQLSLTATDPAGADLSFLDTMAVFVEAPELERARVASAPEFPEGEPTVWFARDDVDLTDYVTSQSMTLATDVSGHRPDDDTTVEARFQLSVGAKVKGLVRQL